MSFCGVTVTANKLANLPICRRRVCAQCDLLRLDRTLLQLRALMHMLRAGALVALALTAHAAEEPKAAAPLRPNIIFNLVDVRLFRAQPMA